jgi:hypothetical protein
MWVTRRSNRHQHTLRVFKPVGPHPPPRPTPLPIAAWLAIPMLFAAAVLGITAILGLLLGSVWQVTLSPALFGAAAAVTGLIGVGAEWPRCRKVCVRLAYPAALFAVGLVMGGPPVPTGVAILVGLPALATLVYLCRQERQSELSRR